MTAEFLRHEPCEVCGSSDAKAIYSDGNTYCFSCQNFTSDNDINQNHYMTTNVQFKGSAQRLHKRKISESTCQHYKIYRDGDLLRFPYFSSNKTLQGFKTKNKLKDFKYEGNTTDTLFGQSLFPTTGKLIIVYEGELDAASGWEAYPNWAHVSLPHGAGSAKKDIQKQLQLFQGYQEIVLFFDKDEAGKRATEQVAPLLPSGKVKIAHLPDPYKDASDALQAGDPQAIRVAIWNASPYQPDGIVDGKSLLELVTNPSPPCDFEYPFAGLQQMTHGIRYGELTVISAGTGQGKSTLTRQLCVHLLEQGEKVGYIALEESNRRTALGLMSVATGKALHLGEHPKETLQEAYDYTLKNWDLFLYDHFGSADPDIIYSRIEYMALALETKTIFLDHLSILISGLDGDERKMIDNTMTRLRSLVERTGIKLFLVSHLRRTQTDKNHEEGARVTLGQLRGSAAISQLADEVIGLERNQQKTDDQDTTVLRLLKNRYSGEVGVASQLKYNKDTCKYDEITNPIFNPSTDF
jgi:twinkle protein